MGTYVHYSVVRGQKQERALGELVWAATIGWATMRRSILGGVAVDSIDFSAEPPFEVGQLA